MKAELSARWERVILVCGKCSRRVDGGWGAKGRTGLIKALRQELGVKRGVKARVGVVETKCLGVCPKNAVIALDAARPDRWLLARPGENVRDVLARLSAPAPVIAD